MSKKRHVLPVIVGFGASTLSGCNTSVKPRDTDPTNGQPTTAKSTPTTPPTTIVRDKGPIPPRLGGVVKPVPRPPVRPAPAPRSATRVEARASAPHKSAGRKGVGGERVAVAVVHEHPPGQACTPLTEAEVKKALDDLRTATP